MHFLRAGILTWENEYGHKVCDFTIALFIYQFNTFNNQFSCKIVSVKGQHGGTVGSSGYCLCGVSYVLLMSAWVFFGLSGFLPPSTNIPYRVYSCLVPSVPVDYRSSTANTTRIKRFALDKGVYQMP